MRNADGRSPPKPILLMPTKQLGLELEHWPQCALRPETRREHLSELQAWLGLTPFDSSHFRHFVHQLSELAQQTDWTTKRDQSFL